MMLRLLYNVEPTYSDKVKAIAYRYKGKFTTIQPDSQPIENFIQQEIIFENIADMNKFIYGAYMVAGYYFLVESIMYTTSYF